ncbi:hypothetical protein DY000_02015039 [Brassica cretica]|uniref:Uncharacterized protein n=1 Tax=Brassica cretica TaxID=69181 RepID=A0ABQ7CTH3_BRACR|nr:hypothetical protein DY000_02015039 [Brassica cretica]
MGFLHLEGTQHLVGVELFACALCFIKTMEWLPFLRVSHWGLGLSRMLSGNRRRLLGFWLMEVSQDTNPFGTGSSLHQIVAELSVVLGPVRAGLRL